MAIATINPSTGETVRTFDELTDAELDAELDAPRPAFRAFRRSTLDERAAALLRAAAILEAEQDALGRLMALEMGKLAKAGRDEAAKCAWGCRFYAEHGAAMLADEPRGDERRRRQLRALPAARPVLAIMPWNFPFWQVFRFAAPALMAGNVVLLKHASNVPQCALLIEDILRRAGVPEGVFQTLLVDVAQVPH